MHQHHRSMIPMNDELIAKIHETHRDVRWICRTLTEMKETDTRFDDRIHSLEEWQAESAGAGKRTGGIIAGISALIAAVSALVVQWLGMD